METQNNLLNEFTEPSYDYAGSGQRFFNYLIDMVAFYALMFLVGIVLGLATVAGVAEAGSSSYVILSYAFAFGVFVLYYTLLEGSKGKTLGKLITRTKVLTEDLEPITYKQAFVRSICRFVPFEPLSAFFGITMWHDQWTKTIVVKDK